MRKLLIVCPHFPPVNLPDHQRVRLALPYFAQFGWDVETLIVDPKYVEGAKDQLLNRSLPENTKVTAVRAIPQRLTRKFGFGGLPTRALPILAAAGGRLLASRTFDLVFFSTTVFPALILGPWWLRRYGIPYVVDFQDPWRNDYYARSGVPAPGGKLKYGLNAAFARLCEPRVVRDAAHVIAVSPAYCKAFAERYADFDQSRCSVLPFGGSRFDFDLLPSLAPTQQFFSKNEGRHFVYVGAAGPNMFPTLRSLFCALQTEVESNPSSWAGVKFHFVGSSYAPGFTNRSIEQLATEYGLAAMVNEHPGRVPYFDALRIMRDADVVLIIGSDDQTYNPSKVYPTVLAKRPILAILRSESLAVQALKLGGVEHIVTFDSAIPNDRIVESLRQALQTLLQGIPQADLEIPDAFVTEHSAEAMTRKLCAVFDQAVQTKAR